MYERVEDLESDLRVDLFEFEKYLTKFDTNEILELGELYKKKTTRKLAEIIVRGLK